MQFTDNERGSPTQAKGTGLRKVMDFVADFNETDVASSKEALVKCEAEASESPMPLTTWGDCLQDPPAEEKKTVMILANRPPEQTSARPFLATQKCGQPVGFLPQQQAPLDVVPLLLAEPEQISGPRLRHVGASYFEGEDGYYYVDHTGNHRRFTDFTICILAEEKVQTIDGGITVFLNVELKNDQGQEKVLRVLAEEWADLASKIERHATAFMIFHDEVHGARFSWKTQVRHSR